MRNGIIIDGVRYEVVESDRERCCVECDLKVFCKKLSSCLADEMTNFEKDHIFKKRNEMKLTNKEKAKKLRLFDSVTFKTGIKGEMETIVMYVCGIFLGVTDDDIVVYATFEGNEGDQFEYKISELYSINGVVVI